MMDGEGGQKTLNVRLHNYLMFVNVKVNCALRGDPARNVRYCWMTHPRFGACRCVRSLKPIQEGEEILADYDYDMSHSDVPA